MLRALDHNLHNNFQNIALISDSYRDMTHYIKRKLKYHLYKNDFFNLAA